jgi:TPP-dependent 2-oxoacid decarboxylase
MKPVLKQENSSHYISDGEMIKFIVENSDITWNKCCNFVRDNDIVGGEYGNAFWDKADFPLDPAEYNEEQIKWIGGFFEAHPWIEKMMIVFDD